MVIFRNRDGVLLSASLAGGDAERRRVFEECSSAQLLPCETFMTVNANRNRYWPGAEARKTYTATAWIKGQVDDGYNRKLYVASGYPGREQTWQMALDACTTANPQRECQVAGWTGGGFIQVGTDGKGGDFAVPENTLERARMSGERQCRVSRATNCQLQAVFDSRTRGQFIHDFTTVGAN